MKNRLWNILHKVSCSSNTCSKIKDHTCSIEACKLESIIETLLNSNRVIVTPCEFGTHIYRILLEIPDGETQCYECQYNSSGFGDFYCDHNYIGWPTMEEKILEPEDVCPKYVPYIYEQPMTPEFWVANEKWFNTTWFLTKEQAEAALERFKNETSLSKDCT